MQSGTKTNKKKEKYMKQKIYKQSKQTNKKKTSNKSLKTFKIKINASTLSFNFEITAVQTRKPNVFHAQKYLPNGIKYVGEQVEINGTPGGNIPKSASVLFFMSL